MRAEDTRETGANFNRARHYQTLIGLGFAALGVVALALGHIEAGAALIAVGMGLVPTRTVKLGAR